MKTHEKEARQVVEAIRTLASKPENLDNLESYLTHCFAAWLEKYANSPENMACELQEFANMTI